MNSEQFTKRLVGELSWKRFVRSTLLILVIVYSALFVYGYFFSEHLIFQPHPSSYTDGPRFIKLKSGDSAQITAIYLPSPRAQYAILYSHGNAEDLGDLLPMLEDIQGSGFTVLAYDYRGYGTSGGKPTEQGAYQDEDAAYDYLIKDQGVAPSHVIALGRSLGGAMAIDLASRRAVGGLVVQSSFVTAFRVMTGIPILPFDKFRNVEKIKNVHRPVLVIHGRADEVIGFWHGLTLFREANPPKRSFFVEGAGHDDLYQVANRRYLNALHEFAASIDSTR